MAVQGSSPTYASNLERYSAPVMASPISRSTTNPVSGPVGIPMSAEGERRHHARIWPGVGAGIVESPFDHRRLVGWRTREHGPATGGIVERGDQDGVVGGRVHGSALPWCTSRASSTRAEKASATLREPNSTTGVY